MSEIDISAEAVERHVNVEWPGPAWGERNKELLRALRAALTAKEAENARLREALEGARIRLSGADWIIRTALEQEGTGDE